MTVEGCRVTCTFFAVQPPHDDSDHRVLQDGISNHVITSEIFEGVRHSARGRGLDVGVIRLAGIRKHSKAKVN